MDGCEILKRRGSTGVRRVFLVFTSVLNIHHNPILAAAFDLNKLLSRIYLRTIIGLL